MANEWKHGINLIPPALLSTISGLTEGGLDLADSALGLVEGGLDAASLLYVQPQSILANLGFSATQLKTEVEDFFSRGGTMLITSPFQYGIGHGTGIFRTLSFPGCVAVTAAKFDDINDPQRLYIQNSPVQMISLLIGAGTPALFLDLLESLHDLLSLKELRFAIRKIKQLLKLEKERLVLKNAPWPPYYQGFQMRDIPQLAQAEKATLQILNFFLAWDKKLQNMLSILADLTAQKRQQVQRVREDLATAVALFNLSLEKNGVYRYYSEANSTAQLKQNLLTATGGAGAELSLCLQVKFVATDYILDPMKEILDL